MMFKLLVAVCTLVITIQGILLGTPPLQQAREGLLSELKSRADMSMTEKLMRARLLRRSEKLVIEHNSNPSREYNQILNKFSVMTPSERAAYLGYRNTTDDMENEVVSKRDTTEEEESLLPDEFNHRDHGHVTSVKDQSWCGSCYAFATAGAFEGSYSQATGALTSFSAKELVDCVPRTQSTGGCSGGSVSRSFKWMLSSGRLATENDIPYQPREDSCTSWAGKPNGIRNANFISFENIKSTEPTGLSDEVVKTTLMSYTPAVVMKVEDSFHLYGMGYYRGYYNGCENPDEARGGGSHALILVGYAPEYWEAKNSWGADWGDQGFVKFSRRRQNICFLTNRLIYPIVEYEDKGEEYDVDEDVVFDDLVNVAVDKSVRSSDRTDHTDITDGDERTCHRTEPHSTAYFRVDLSESYDIERVEIVTDDPHALLGGNIHVGNSGDWRDTKLGKVEEIDRGIAVLRPQSTVGGRYVYIERYTNGKEKHRLSVCEIRVFAEVSGQGCPRGTTRCDDGTCRHIHMC